MLSLLSNLDFGVESFEITLGLDLEQRGSILLLAFFHPVSVDVERSHVDHAPVRLESVRVLEQLDELDRLWFALERLQTWDYHDRFDVDTERLARKEHALGDRLFNKRLEKCF